MHKRGDQWIEIIDGQEHMVKAVGNDHIACIANFGCELCVFFGGSDQTGCPDCKFNDEPFQFHPNCIVDGDGIVISLGVLKDGLLTCYFCGEYPEILMKEDYCGKFLFYIDHDCDAGCVETQRYYSLQELKDAWNRRV